MNSAPALALGVRAIKSGFFVFPAALSWDPVKKKINKKPANRRGHLDATNDPDELRRQFNGATTPPGAEYGVGLCPGRSGHLVVDVDVPDGDDQLDAYEEKYGPLPLGPRITTPSGGRHILLKKGDRYVDNSCLASSIDIRSDAGWIVCPGSSSQHGNWETDLATKGLPVPDAPQWIFDTLTANGAKSAGGGAKGHWGRLDEATLIEADRVALAALKRLGGHGEYVSDGSIQVCRPGKTAGSSASIGYIGPGMVKVFSSNWPPLHAEARYSADELHAIADLVEAGDDEGAKRAADPMATTLGDPPAAAPFVDTTPAFATYDPKMPFPLDVWPDELVTFWQQVGIATSVDPAAAATLSLVVLGAAIGNSRALLMDDTDWDERTNFWVANVASSGGRKTPVGKKVRAPIRKIQSELFASYASSLEEWGMDIKDGGQGGKGTPPVPHQILVKDITIESLGEIMCNNPRSTLLYSDELSKWLLSHGMYKANGGNDREQYLEMWPKEDLIINRKSKPALIVKDPHLSIGGTTQPHVLAQLLETGDGFGQRFLVCVAPPLHRNERAPAVTVAATEAYERLVRRLYALKGAPDGQPQWIEWGGGAKEAMVDHRVRFVDEEESGHLSPVLQTVWAKAQSWLGRLSVLLACVRHVSTGEACVVTPEVIAAAASIIDYYFNGSVAIFDEGVDMAPPERYSALGPEAEALLIRWLRKKGGRATMNDVAHNGPRVWRNAAAKSRSETLTGMQVTGKILFGEEACQRGRSFVIELLGQ
jgi:hypothetical protein